MLRHQPLVKESRFLSSANSPEYSLYFLAFITAEDPLCSVRKYAGNCLLCVVIMPYSYPPVRTYYRRSGG